MEVSKKAVLLHAFLKEALPNGVMVALQILVLSVWVRVLVRQHNERTHNGLRPFLFAHIKQRHYFCAF